MVFQLYYSMSIFAANFLVLTFNDFHFTYWGIVGASLWVPASIFSIFAIKFLGISVATGLWAGLTSMFFNNYSINGCSYRIIHLGCCNTS